MNADLLFYRDDESAAEWLKNMPLQIAGERGRHLLDLAGLRLRFNHSHAQGGINNVSASQDQISWARPQFRMATEWPAILRASSWAAVERTLETQEGPPRGGPSCVSHRCTFTPAN
jgi:hypothetical protein